MIRRGLRLAAATVGWLLLVAAAGVALARLLGDDGGALALVVLATPYAVLPALAGLLLAVVARARLRAVVAVAVLGALCATQAPLVLADGGDGKDADDAAAGEPITVLTTNLQFGRADLAAVVAAGDREGVDVLAVQELTEPAATRLAADLRRRLPYRYVVSRPGAGGSGLWSRAPLSGGRTLGGLTLANLVAQVDLGGARLTVASLHPVPPLPGRTAAWRREHAVLRAELARLRGPVVAAGDFNATVDHAVLRRLGDDGFTAAADSAGAGLVRTWPTDLTLARPLGVPLPVGGVPVIGIDHVLVRGPWRATRVDTVRVGGTDHAAVLAQLRPAG